MEDWDERKTSGRGVEEEEEEEEEEKKKKMDRKRGGKGYK